MFANTNGKDIARYLKQEASKLAASINPFMGGQVALNRAALS